MIPFTRAVTWVLLAEGEWATEADGTRSRWGINERWHPDVDLDTLTREGAVELYRARYWDQARCGELPWPLSFGLFDGAVQHDPVTATRLLQRALHTRDDGRVGPLTIEAATRAPAVDVLEDYLARRAVYYAGLPTWPENGRGWVRRLLSLHREALRP